MSPAWALLIGHSDSVRVSWAGLRPLVELRRWDGSRVVYRPKFSGHLSLGPLTSYGRLLTIGRGT